MTVATARFPRTAYARRADDLAGDLLSWAVALSNPFRAEEAVALDEWTTQEARARARVLLEVGRQLEVIADRIRAIR